MSRHNKVNPDHYKTAGRLTADDLARERRKQRGLRESNPRARRRDAALPQRNTAPATRPRSGQRSAPRRTGSKA